MISAAHATASTGPCKYVCNAHVLIAPSDNQGKRLKTTIETSRFFELFHFTSTTLLKCWLECRSVCMWLHLLPLYRLSPPPAVMVLIVLAGHRISPLTFSFGTTLNYKSFHFENATCFNWPVNHFLVLAITGMCDKVLLIG